MLPDLCCITSFKARHRLAGCMTEPCLDWKCLCRAVLNADCSVNESAWYCTYLACLTLESAVPYDMHMWTASLAVLAQQYIGTAVCLTFSAKGNCSVHGPGLVEPLCVGMQRAKGMWTRRSLFQGGCACLAVSLFNRVTTYAVSSMLWEHFPISSVRHTIPAALAPWRGSERLPACKRLKLHASAASGVEAHKCANHTVCRVFGWGSITLTYNWLLCLGW
jgi:hypothetical protein